MSTVLQLNIISGENALYVFDVTGSYSSTNKEGWGQPNTQISEIESAFLSIKEPDSDSFVEVDVFPTLPTTGKIGYEIDPSYFEREELLPGIYEIDYLANSATENLSQSCLFYYYYPLQCCIQEKRNALSLTDFSSDKAKEVYELEALLENAIWAACSGMIDQAKEINDLLRSKCKCCNC